MLSSTTIKPIQLQVSPSWSQSISLPKLIQVFNNLFIAAFPVMKLLPAIHIINQAIQRKELRSTSTIVETSSGNFALGLAIVCNELGLPLFIASDPAIDRRLQNRLESLHAHVHIVEKPALGGGFQQPRLDVVQEFLKSNPDAYWTRQYDNDDNPAAYAAFGAFLLEHFGDNFTLVGAVGSGGSTVGTIRNLRQVNSTIQLVGVDTYNSILFGLPDGRRLLRGLGNSVMPKNLDHTCYDEIHWISAAQAFLATQNLHAQHSIFGGPTSGAAFLAARHLAQKDPHRTVVFIGADDGERYLDTVFSHQWQEEQGVNICELCPEPRLVQSLEQVSEAASPWTVLPWRRRSLNQVVGTSSEK